MTTTISRLDLAGLQFFAFLAFAGFAAKHNGIGWDALPFVIDLVISIFFLLACLRNAERWFSAWRCRA